MANDSDKRSPMLRACSLWERTSARGQVYLTGRLGGLRVLIMQNRDHEKDGDPTHVLLFTEAPPAKPKPATEQRSRL